MTRTTAQPPEPPSTLESWKEIAAYLRRGVRTVRRWEKEEGLPVHRHAHKTLGSVYAHPAEIDAWRETRRAKSRLPPRGGTASRESQRRRLIAVLPFENLGGRSGADYLAEGLTEEMIGVLARLNPDALGVIARTSVMQYRGKKRTIRRIADELHVDYVLEGSVQREGDHIRVAVQLIDARDEAHLWSGTYEQTFEGILALQRKLARDIAGEIRLRLSRRGSQQTQQAGAVSADAYRAHLRGRHLLNDFTPSSIRRSAEFFRRAIQADPTYAPAYASLAEATQQLSVWTDAPPAALFGQAMKAAETAVRLDPHLPDAYASLGLINAYYTWNWGEAERCFEQALALNPGCSPARQWYAEYLGAVGRIDDALRVIEGALIYDPLSRSIRATRAFVLWLGRRYDEAVVQAQLVLALDPDYPMALIRLGVAYAGKGMFSDAAKVFRRAAKVAPELLDAQGLLGYAQARAGHRDAALRQLRHLQRLAKRRYVPPFILAMPLIGLGQADEAIDLIEEEYAARGWYLLLIKHGSQFDPLRSHPRFQALIERMQFPG